MFNHRTALAGSASVLAIATVLAAPGLPAYAQDAGTSGADVTRFGTVTTVATKRRQSLLDTIGSTSSVDREDIDRRIPSTLDDVLRDIPSVEGDGGPRSTAEQFNIRGLDNERIVLRVDGARANFQAGHRGRVFVDPDLIQRVEVVRGPSLIYGSGALGGVISLELRSADDFLDLGRTHGARVRFSGATFNDEFAQSYTGFTRHDWVGAVLSFSHRISGRVQAGPREYPTERNFVPFSSDNILSGLARFDFEPAPGHTGFFTFSVYDNDNLIPTAANTNTTNTIADRTTREERYVWGYNYDPAGNHWIDTTARVYLNRVRINELVVSNDANFGREDRTSLTTVGVDLFNVSKLQLADDWAKLALTYGIEYYRDSQTGTRDGQPRGQFPDASSDVLGSYLQGQFTFFDRFILTGALRYDSFTLDADNKTGRSEANLSKSGGIGFRPIENLLLYAKYAEAFRAPSLTETYATGVHFPLFAGLNNVFVPNPNLRPETARTIEAGAAMEFRDVFMRSDRIVGQFAIYRSDIDDFIDLQVINNPTFIPPFGPFVCAPCTSQSVNIRDARIFGYEGQISYTSPWLFGSVAGSYMIGENRTTGGSLRSIPARRLSILIGTQIPDWDIATGFRTTMTSDQNRVPDGTSPTSGYVVADWFLSWVPSGRTIPQLRGFRLDLGIDNIGNKRYRRHLSELPEAGRNFKIAVSYTIQFGGEEQ